MTTVTLQDYRDRPALSFELHLQARRERAMAINHFLKQAVARITARLAHVHRPSGLAARWG